MNKYKSFIRILVIGGVLLSGGVVTSCSDDNEPTDRTFSIDGVDTEAGDCIELFVSQSGKGYHKNLDGLQLSGAYTYIIRTNSHWMIVPKTEGTEDWVRFIATEGQSDSKFYFGVWPNNTFDTRVADFSLVLDGVEQPKTFIHIEQAPTLPTFSLVGGTLYNIADTGGEAVIDITTNTGECGFEIEYPNAADGEWLTFDTERSKPASLIFKAEANSSEDEREAYVTVYSKLFPEMKARVQVVQNTFALVLFEDFTAFNYTSTTNIWDGTGERAIENWSATAAPGWVGLLNGTQTAARVYARKGYILVGNGGRIGTVASAPFEKLEDKTSDVNVTFDCVGYVTEGGVRDYSDLYIGVWGPGTIDGETEDLTVNYKQLGGKTTLKVKHIEITNFPNMPVGVFPAGYDEWDSENARVRLRVNGATAETRIILMGGYWETLRATNKYDSPDPVQNGVTYRRNNKNNRLAFDNFKVMQILR